MVIQVLLRSSSEESGAQYVMMALMREMHMCYVEWQASGKYSVVHDLIEVFWPKSSYVCNGAQ